MCDWLRGTDLNSFFRHSCFNDRAYQKVSTSFSVVSSRNPVATALFRCWTSCILWNSQTFTFIAFLLLLGSSSLFNLASNLANHSSILSNLLSPSSFISLIVEFIQLIWALTDCSTVSLVCFITDSILFIISSIFACDIVDILSRRAVTSLGFPSSNPLISLHGSDDFLFHLSVSCSPSRGH